MIKLNGENVKCADVDTISADDKDLSITITKLNGKKVTQTYPSKAAWSTAQNKVVKSYEAGDKAEVVYAPPVESIGRPEVDVRSLERLKAAGFTSKWIMMLITNFDVKNSLQ